ncbi:MAG: TonB family protein [Nitrospirae bacterium]|nr:TonB family protein [Nitrospirota bacterium]
MEIVILHPDAQQLSPQVKKRPSPLVSIHRPRSVPAPAMIKKQEPPPEPKTEPVPSNPSPGPTLPESSQDSNLSETSGKLKSDQNPGGTSSLLIPQEPAYAPLFKVTRLPAVLKEVKPAYPQLAKSLQKEAAVLLEVRLSEKGEVLKVRIIRGAGNGFEEAAIEAMKQFLFEPAYVGEKQVPVIIQYSIKFKLTD